MMIEPFDRLKAIAAPLPYPNIDTDIIMPKRFLKRIDRAGLADGAFHELRFDRAGQKRPDFILNQEPYSKAKILIAGENFGCGSSREYAVWGLMQLGIRAIIAPTISGIFFGNCEKNGLLAITLDSAETERLLKIIDDPVNSEIVIDLPNQTIQTTMEDIIEFEISQARKELLISGADHIQLTLNNAGLISKFEEDYVRAYPWFSKS